MTSNIVRIAVPVPLRQLFDYRTNQEIAPGSRVLVPFGRRKVVGIAVEMVAESSHKKLRPIVDVLDDAPSIEAEMLGFLRWVSSYYHHPPGETFHAALPTLCRVPERLKPPQGAAWFRAAGDSGEAVAVLGRAPAQAALRNFLVEGGWCSTAGLDNRFERWRDAMRSLEKKGLAERQMLHVSPRDPDLPPAIELTDEQSAACDRITAHLSRFKVALLQGITGSGKTEVYLEAARECIAKGRQVLFLVPEIALTPQLVARVKAQLGERVLPLHSGMPEGARFETWWLAREGLADVVLGTRSAVFVPLKNPGLIVVDEEHDVSYKQQDSLRYHARDLAIKRGQMNNIPVVLGSATPSMESLHNVRSGRFEVLKLSQRFGAAKLPSIQTVDLEVHEPVDGLSSPVVEAINRCLDEKQQTIVYINRRGYAPLVRCYSCEWEASCGRCSAALTYHRRRNQFRCHHCGYTERAEFRCPDCGTDLYFAGAGTQRVEQALQGKFPHARVTRLDRDEANTPNKLYRQLAAIRDGEVDIVVGTQLITKGHDFANVALVCIVNADQGLFSADFRAPEIMFQQLLQVSGRAGRASADGRVLIQTRHASHPVFRMIETHNYPAFAEDCLDQRRAADYPPVGSFALFRAESEDEARPLKFLEAVRKVGEGLRSNFGIAGLEVLYPIPSPMERLAGRYRAQLLVRSVQRGSLHRLLDAWLEALATVPTPGDLRWSLDVDPMDMS